MSYALQVERQDPLKYAEQWVAKNEARRRTGGPSNDRCERHDLSADTGRLARAHASSLRGCAGGGARLRRGRRALAAANADLTIRKTHQWIDYDRTKA